MASRTLLALGAAGALVLAGCAEAAQSRLDFTSTEQVAIKEIVIGAGGGDVTVQGADTTEVNIKRVVRYRGSEPGQTYRVTGQVLSVDTDCGQHCWVDYEIVAPKGVVVRGENGSGNISLTGVSTVDIEVGSGELAVTDASGAVTVEAGSGNIAIVRVAGDLEAKTGSGDIDARGLSGKQIAAEAGSGNIALTLDKPAGVRVHTGSGDVEVTVPSGGSYRLDARSGSGDQTVGIPHSATGTHLLDVETGSGNILIQHR